MAAAASVLAPVGVAAVMVVEVAVVARRFPVFQPCLLPLAAPLPCPPTPLPPPARPPLPSTTSVLRGAHISGNPSGRQHTGRGISFLPSDQTEREGPLKEGQLSAWSWGLAVWLRGEAATSCFPAPLMLMLMLLSGRRNRQWDRSPSSACILLRRERAALI